MPSRCGSMVGSMASVCCLNGVRVVPGVAAATRRWRRDGRGGSGFCLGLGVGGGRRCVEGCACHCHIHARTRRHTACCGPRHAAALSENPKATYRKPPFLLSSCRPRVRLRLACTRVVVKQANLNRGAHGGQSPFTTRPIHTQHRTYKPSPRACDTWASIHACT